MESLSKYLHMEIIGFLTATDALNLSITSKSFKNDLDLSIIDDTFSHQLEDQHWYGDYRTGDEIRIWFRFFPLCFQDRIHSIQFTANCVDQGWGNRKGNLYIFEEDENVNHRRGKCLASSPTLEHHCTSTKFEFQPKSIKNCLICYKVGGGGGHELFVRNPRIRLLLQNSEGIGHVAPILQNKVIKPTLQDDFSLKLLIGTIEALKKRIEYKEKQDESLVLLLSSIGVDTTDIQLLNRMKMFLDQLEKLSGHAQDVHFNIPNSYSSSDSESDSYY